MTFSQDYRGRKGQNLRWFRFEAESGRARTVDKPRRPNIAVACSRTFSRALPAAVRPPPSGYLIHPGLGRPRPGIIQARRLRSGRHRSGPWPFSPCSSSGIPSPICPARLTFASPDRNPPLWALAQGRASWISFFARRYQRKWHDFPGRLGSDLRKRVALSI